MKRKYYKVVRILKNNRKVSCVVKEKELRLSYSENNFTYPKIENNIIYFHIDKMNIYKELEKADIISLEALTTKKQAYKTH